MFTDSLGGHLGTRLELRGGLIEASLVDLGEVQGHLARWRGAAEPNWPSLATTPVPEQR